MNVGVLSGSTNEDTGELIAPYAAANEYGTLTIPARPALRNAIAEKSIDWAEQLANGVKSANGKPGDIESVFNALGMTIVQDFVDSIESFTPPPNAPSTVKAKTKKGRAEPGKTLIDSGSYERSINYEIIKGEE